MFEYQGYQGIVEFDYDAGIFFGEVIDLRDVITFQGKTVEELEKSFHDSVDEYVAFCKELGRKPEKPFSGRFNIRVKPELHRAIVAKAKKTNKSLNQWVSAALENAVLPVD